MMALDADAIFYFGFHPKGRTKQKVIVQPRTKQKKDHRVMTNSLYAVNAVKS